MSKSVTAHKLQPRTMSIEMLQDVWQLWRGWKLHSQRW